MHAQTLSQPLAAVPVGPKLYPIAQLEPRDFALRYGDMGIIKNGTGKPMFGELGCAWLRVLRTLIAGEHPELTDDYLTAWMSTALSILVANEWQRQFFAIAPRPAAGA